MKTTLLLEQLTPELRTRAGGKADALAEVSRRGYPVPSSLLIPGNVYRRYLQETEVGDQILMELGRKDFLKMRWEEIWDAALRIRHLFLRIPLPHSLETALADALAAFFGDQPLVFRSSAPGEDGAATSFAGLHSSFVNIRGIETQMLAVRKVWASLWSDRALLYRKELGLDIAASTMAVLVQELVVGEKSGVIFSISPSDPRRLAIEAVPGLNQGLVEGSVEPDFWELDRETCRTITFRAAERHCQMTPAGNGLQLVPLPAEKGDQPVLNTEEIRQLAQTALALEKDLGQPQDIEWTWSDDRLTLLQARPVTTRTDNPDDPRLWYLSLRRSLENLEQLRDNIEKNVIPGMEAEARQLAEVDLQALDDCKLARQILLRRQARQHWESTYRSECIPMAHGIRLFGEFYNDALQPEDPFEFVDLLKGAQLKAVDRNCRLAAWAEHLRRDATLRQALASTPTAIPKQSAVQLAALAEELGLEITLVCKLLLEMARTSATGVSRKNETLEKHYLEGFAGDERRQAARILAIGRASYRLRDDDNISLDKIVREVQRAEREGRRRLEGKLSPSLENLLRDEKGASSPPIRPGTIADHGPTADFRARQLQGQPASPGLATATARVIHAKEDLAEFRAGEILVCDAIDPNMTFVVPLAGGIIERRGGMLIHGAIIAREYGIPCVSGIAGAADIIATGDRITIDGYLGLVFFPPTAGKLFRSEQSAPLRRELDDAGE